MQKLTRRQLLRSAVASGATLVASWFNLQRAAASVDPAIPVAPTVRRLSWFSADELAFVNAALGRLIPADELGAGARKPTSPSSSTSSWPAPSAAPKPGTCKAHGATACRNRVISSKLTPAQLYRAAIPAIDAYCRRTYGGKAFAALGADMQDQVLHGLEEGKVDLQGPPAKEFFTQFWQNVNEGFFADPMYGGNRDFAGWKLVGFPGPRYNYVAEIEQYGKPYALPPVGLLGRDGSALRKT